MLRLLAIIAFLTPAISMANVKYEIVHSEIKEFVSHSFGEGYMGLQEKKKEPGYGIFFSVKVFSKNEKEIMDFVQSDKISKQVCRNALTRSLLESLYTINITYLDASDTEIIRTGLNKNSCV